MRGRLSRPNAKHASAGGLLSGIENAKLNYCVKPNLRLLGPRLGKQLSALRAALEQLDSRAGELARAVAAGEIVTLPFGDGSLALAPGELLIESAALAGENPRRATKDTRISCVLRGPSCAFGDS